MNGCLDEAGPVNRLLTGRELRELLVDALADHADLGFV